MHMIAKNPSKINDHFLTHAKLSQFASLNNRFVDCFGMYLKTLYYHIHESTHCTHKHVKNTCIYTSTGAKYTIIPQ